MRNFQGTFGTPNRSFISAFSICVTVPLHFLYQIFQVSFLFHVLNSWIKFRRDKAFICVVYLVEPKAVRPVYDYYFLTKKSSKLFMHRSSDQRCSMEKGRPATLLKRRLWYRYFPVNFVKFLRTPIFREHLWWLLLYATMNYWMWALL